MTGLATALVILVAGLAATGGVLSDGSAQGPPRTALVVDAQAARHGRELLDPRLRAVDAEVRVPRTADEARTDLRYFAAQGYRIVVAGATTTVAATATTVGVQRAPDLAAALSTAAR
jgi:hypothetical protein